MSVWARTSDTDDSDDKKNRPHSKRKMIGKDARDECKKICFRPKVHISVDAMDFHRWFHGSAVPALLCEKMRTEQKAKAEKLPFYTFLSKPFKASQTKTKGSS